MRATASERFKQKIVRTEQGCWDWTGEIIWNGYGRFQVKGKRVLTHRWAYEQQNGPIPNGLELDHLCRNRRCANPDHLEAVTRSENHRRSMPTVELARKLVYFRKDRSA